MIESEPDHEDPLEMILRIAEKEGLKRECWVFSQVETECASEDSADLGLVYSYKGARAYLEVSSQIILAHEQKEDAARQVTDIGSVTTSGVELYLFSSEDSDRIAMVTFREGLRSSYDYSKGTYPELDKMFADADYSAEKFVHAMIKGYKKLNSQKAPSTH